MDIIFNSLRKVFLPQRYEGVYDIDCVYFMLVIDI